MVSDTDSETDLEEMPNRVRRPETPINTSYSDNDDTGFIMNDDGGKERVALEEAVAYSKMNNDDYQVLGKCHVGPGAQVGGQAECDAKSKAVFHKVHDMLQNSAAKDAFKN